MNIKGRAILVGYVVRINYGEAKGWGGLSCEWACARVCVCVCVCVCGSSSSCTGKASVDESREAYRGWWGGWRISINERKKNEMCPILILGVLMVGVQGTLSDSGCR